MSASLPRFRRFGQTVDADLAGIHRDVSHVTSSARRSSTNRGRSVITPSTWWSSTISRSSSVVDGPDVHLVAGRLDRRHQAGPGAHQADPGPGDPGAERQPAAADPGRQDLQQVDRRDGRAPGPGSGAARARRTTSRSPAPGVRLGLGQAVPAQHLDQPALDLGAVPGRVFGLDEQAHRPAAVAQRLQQPVEGEQPGEVGQRLLVGRVAGVPGAEVERVELGQRLAC